MDRFVGLLLIEVLRSWFARPEGERPTWYRSQADPIVGRALSIMHSNPAHPWTVASLAAETGVSRAALARRFHAFVGTRHHFRASPLRKRRTLAARAEVWGCSTILFSDRT